MDNIESTILSCYRRFINDNNREPKVEELRELVKQKEIKVSEKIELINFIKQFIKDAEKGKHLNLQTGKPIKDVTVRTYKQTLFLLNEFSKTKYWKLKFKDINPDFRKEFVHFLTKEYICPDTGKPFKPNSAGKHLTNIRTFMTNAFEKKLTDNQDFHLKGFKVIREDVDSIYLSKQEIEAVEYVKKNGRITNAEYQKLNKVSKRTALRDLDNLSTKSVLQKKEKRKVPTTS